VPDCVLCLQAAVHTEARLAAVQRQYEAEVEAGARLRAGNEELTQQLADAQRQLRGAQQQGAAGQSALEEKAALEEQVRKKQKSSTAHVCDQQIATAAFVGASQVVRQDPPCLLVAPSSLYPRSLYCSLLVHNWGLVNVSTALVLWSLPQRLTPALYIRWSSCSPSWRQRRRVSLRLGPARPRLPRPSSGRRAAGRSGSGSTGHAWQGRKGQTSFSTGRFRRRPLALQQYRVGGWSLPLIPGATRSCTAPQPGPVVFPRYAQLLRGLRSKHRQTALEAAQRVAALEAALEAEKARAAEVGAQAAQMQAAAGREREQLVEQHIQNLQDVEAKMLAAQTRWATTTLRKGRKGVVVLDWDISMTVSLAS
jgi:hypothetical protein